MDMGDGATALSRASKIHGVAGVRLGYAERRTVTNGTETVVAPDCERVCFVHPASRMKVFLKDGCESPEG